MITVFSAAVIASKVLHKTGPFNITSQIDNKFSRPPLLPEKFIIELLEAREIFFSVV